MGVLLIPEPIFPFTGVLVGGVLRRFGEWGGIIALILMINSIGYAIVAQCFCVLYRYAILSGNDVFLKIVNSWISYVFGYLYNRGRLYSWNSVLV